MDPSLKSCLTLILLILLPACQSGKPAHAEEPVGKTIGSAHLTKDGLLQNDCQSEECPHFEKLKTGSAFIDADFDNDGYTWAYRTKIPHVTFEVVEDGDKYCRGIVFNLADVQP